MNNVLKVWYFCCLRVPSIEVQVCEAHASWLGHATYFQNVGLCLSRLQQEANAHGGILRMQKIHRGWAGGSFVS